MKGYKATDANMTCLDFQYKLNTEFTHAGEIEPCESGFHFCPNLDDVFCYYYAPDVRVFEIEATGAIKQHKDKCVTNKIKFVREIAIEEFYEQCKHRWEIRCMAAHRHYKLDELVNDLDCDVRCEVVQQGYGLDILINDPYWSIRKQVAKQGYGLDILINDPVAHVRRAAKQYNSVGTNLSQFVSQLFHR